MSLTSLGDSDGTEGGSWEGGTLLFFRGGILGGRRQTTPAVPIELGPTSSCHCVIVRFQIVIGYLFARLHGTVPVSLAIQQEECQ